jgi:kumamolisin
LQEKIAVEQLAEFVKQPNSPMVRGYTSDEIREIAAPADEDYAQLLAQLKSEGLQVVSESPTHLWISVKADSSVFARVFGTQFQHSSNGTRRALTAAQIPSHLSLVAGITGLSNERHSHPKHVAGRFLADQPTGVTRSQITAYYGIDALYAKGLTGAGQHIAVATYMGLNLDDVRQFYSQMALRPGPTVDVVAFNGTAPFDANSAIETELDAEFTGMIAPGAAVHVFASATNDDAGELQLFTAILDDGRAKIANYSWGDCEKHVTPAHATEMAKVFARAVAQGVNVMVASGDSGSDSCQDSTTVADWPAANPDVVAVGGTTLLTNGGQFTEQGWNGSGGGISTLWDSPAYQHKLGAPYTKRSYPDVSFNADPLSGEAIYVTQGSQAGWMSIGGTSMAAPQWSGLLALVGEARAKAGKKPVGFINPIIYGLTAPKYATAFIDVADGSNGAYNAAAGWDAVTGWGSPKAAGLLSILSK